jgi:aminoglycoside phosphotransferase (APT) family kinase protein
MPAQIVAGDVVRRHGDAPADRAPLLVVDPLVEFLDRRGLGSGEPVIEPLGDGHSNYTFTIARGGTTVVLRRPPRPPYPKSAHNVVREARLLQALATTDVPVPAVLAICEDSSVIGVPFYIMGMIDGIAYTERTPEPLDAPGERERVAEELVDALVTLQRVDCRAAGLDGFGRSDGYLDRQLRRFAELLETYRSREIPALDRLTVWLRDHRPESPDPAIVHGDFRLGNVMFAARAPARLIAIFDWEMATAGDPLADVGYLCAMWAQDDDPEGLLKLSRATTEPGYPTRDGLAERYAERSGRSLCEIRWYTTLALWKLCVIMEGNYRRALQGATDNPFVREFGAEVPAIASYAEARARVGTGSSSVRRMPRSGRR